MPPSPTCDRCSGPHPTGDAACRAHRRGERIADRYVIDLLLGEGGFGGVYRARDERIDTFVALKLLHAAQRDNASLTRRFHDEAAVLRRLRAPGLVPVLDAGQHTDGTLYLTMELLDGRSLAAVLADGPLAPPRAVALVRDALDALAVAHAAGVFHRDLKPDNLFVAGERAKVIDFGIARVPDDNDQRNTKTGAVLGTPPYMSPEQITDFKRVDARSDVYSMGAVLFEALTGRRTVDTEDERGEALAAVPVMMKVFMGTEVRRHPRALVPALPEALDALVAKALAPDPAARFADAAAMRDALDALPPLADAPLPAAPPSADPPAPPVASLVAEPTPPAPLPPTRVAVPLAPTEPFVPPVVAPVARPARRRVAALVGVALAAIATTGAGVVALRAPQPATVPPGMVRLDALSFTQGSTPAEAAAAQALCRRTARDPADCRDDVFAREQPAREVRVSTFALDAAEVTTGRFAAWLAQQPDVTWVAGSATELARFERSGVPLALTFRAGHSLASELGLDARDGRPAVREGYADRPISAVTWVAADAFCRATGARLPTEAEWERAARGPTHRTWPWGDAPPGADTRDLTPEGVRSLGGGVSEWVADVAFPYARCEGTCVDPRADGDLAALHVLRGGDRTVGPDAMRSAARSFMAAKEAAPEVGFRCARDVR